MGKQKQIKADDGEIFGTPIWYELLPCVYFTEATDDVIRAVEQGLIHPKLIHPPHYPENPMK